jgi:hypothetical protein
MKSLLRILIPFFFLLLHTLDSLAASGPVMLNMDVPAGAWKAARLKNLPKNAVVAVQVESNGEILVALLDSTSKGKPDVSRPLFTGRVEKRLSFSVTVSQAGDHYLVFDNRRGSEPRAVKVALHAAASAADQMDAANKMMHTLELQLGQIFVFDPFPIGIKQCGTPKSFADPSGVVLCTEYMAHLSSILKDHRKTLDTLSFSLFHEIGRVLLEKWDHPFRSDIDVADEFAAVLMLMLNQKERARGAAECFSRNPSAYYAMKKLFQDDRHPLSPKRAKNVLVWLKDPELVRKWQEVLVPHMKTALLQKLKQQPTSWTDLSLVEAELAKRDKKAI